MDTQKKPEKAKKRGTLGWVLTFAGSKRSSYAVSVILAILSVLAGFVPYIFMSNIVEGLLEKTADIPTPCLNTP